MDNHEAYEASMRAEIPVIAEALQTTLGQRLTAYAVGVADPKAIGKYARAGESGPHPRADVERRLRELYRVTLVLDEESPRTIRAWMIGSNPLLDDRAPIEVLHEENSQPSDRSDELFALVHRASLKFASAA